MGRVIRGSFWGVKWPTIIWIINMSIIRRWFLKQIWLSRLILIHYTVQILKNVLSLKLYNLLTLSWITDFKEIHFFWRVNHSLQIISQSYILYIYSSLNNFPNFHDVVIPISWTYQSIAKLFPNWKQLLSITSPFTFACRRTSAKHNILLMNNGFLTLFFHVGLLFSL